MVSIHVKDYQLCFAQEGPEVAPIIARKEGAVAFVKLYLVKWS